MNRIFQRMKQVAPMLLFATLSVHAQKSPQDMNRFIDNLMKKMTLEEKIGQLNLPVTGEITTGQAKSSDVAKKIEQGLVGGLFNLKGVDKIRDVQKLAVENSRLGIPLALRHGCDTRLRNHLPHPSGTFLHLGYDSHSGIRTYCRHRSQCRRHLLDIQSDGGYLPWMPVGGVCPRATVRPVCGAALRRPWYVVIRERI